MKTKYIVEMTNGETATRVSKNNYVSAVEAVTTNGVRGIMSWHTTVGNAEKAAVNLRRFGFSEIQIHPACLA